MAKIVLFGQAQFGERVFRGLVERGHDLLAACVPPDREGRPADPLKAAAEEHGVRVIQRKSYKGEDAAAAVAAERADVGVLAYVTQIIPLEILDGPRLGSICFHPSLLPKYRGGSAINWQLINGETRGGITLFRPDAGIDAGPIYLQEEIAIGPDDSAGFFYYSKVFEPGVALTLEAVEEVLARRVEGKTQNERLATHDPLCRDEHAAIDWSESAGSVHNLIRGCDPSPGAHALWQGEKLRLYGSRRAAGVRVAEPGTVVALDDDGIEIATTDGSVVLAKLAVTKKLPAAEAAAALALTPGARLENGRARGLPPNAPG